MHKKSSKHSKKESSQKCSSATKKPQVKSKKEKECSVIDLKVPQNSKCELNRCYRDVENKENRKVKHKNDEKHKHKKHESKKDEERQEHHKKRHEHSKDKQSKQSKTENVQPIQCEQPPKHRKSARKDKYEEKLNTSDRLPEEFTKNDNKMGHRSRSFSVESSEHVLKRKERHMRREKTFHIEDLKKLRQTKSQTPLDGKEIVMTKEKSEKKHRHRDKQKDTLEEKPIETPQVLYCQIDSQYPYKKLKKKHHLDELYYASNKNRNEKFSNKPRQSSSRNLNAAFFDDDSHMSKERIYSPEMSYKPPKEKKPIKYSPRKSKMREHAKGTRDQQSKVNLGPYNKFFVFEKNAEIENASRQGHEKRHRRIAREDNERIRKEKEVETETKRENRKHSKQRQEEDLVEKKEELREKIEDDLKSYFVKIQCLIDKKLESILHTTNKEEKAVTKEEVEDSPQRKGEERAHRSHSRKEKKAEKHPEKQYKEYKNRSHRSRALDSQKGMKNVDSEMTHRRNRTPRWSDKNKNPVPLIDSMEIEDRRQRNRSPKLDNFANNQSSELILDVHNLGKTIEENENKHKARTSRSPQIPQRDKSPNKKLEEVYTRIPNDFMINVVEPEKLIETHHRSNRRARNLECKTVSIVGIPSQIKEPTAIFSQAQTCTSMNALEDSVERKKHSKRFKLYYKYSTADNNCHPSESGHSSDRRSVVSDSHKITSDHSEGRESPHRDDLDIPEEEPTKDSQKVIVVMKKERYMRNYRDSFNELSELRPKRHRKQFVPADVPKLNNIVEETSEVSVYSKKIKPTHLPERGYFDMNGSSSECNFEIAKKPTYSDWNLSLRKYGHVPTFAYNSGKSIMSKPRAKMRSPERDIFFGEKMARRIRPNERRMEKPRMIEGDHRLHRIFRDYGKMYSSKSDIDISYDSLHRGRNQRRSPDRENRGIQGKRYPRAESPNSPFRKSPRERSLSRKRQRRFLEPLKEGPQRSIVNHIPEEELTTVDYDASKRQSLSIRERTPSEVSRIPSSTIKKQAEKKPSCVQVPEVSSSQNVKTAACPPKSVRSCSCQYKELVDVGVEVQLKEEITVPEKTFPKTAEAAVEAKMVRRQPTYRRNNTAKALPKSLPKTSEVAVEADLPYVSREDRQGKSAEKKSEPLHPIPYRPFGLKKRPMYNRQKSDIVGNNTTKTLNRPATARPSTTSKNADKGSKEEKDQLPSKKYILVHSRPNLKHDLDTTVAQEERPKTVESPRQAENNMRSSKSAVNIRELSPKPMSSEKGSNFLDKFSDRPLKANSQFLDHCAIKSLINDNPHSSRLFLTKDFTREVNTYQRRKLYDEAIRQKMRKKLQNKLAPQVFEVRYLTLEQDNVEKKQGQGNDATTKTMQNRVKMPSFPCNKNSKAFNKKRNNLKPSTKKSLKNVSKKQSVKSSDSKSQLSSASSSRNPYGSVVNDVDMLTKFRKKKFPDTSVQEIFKGRQLNNKSVTNMLSCCRQLADIQSSSLLIKQSGNSLNKQLSEPNVDIKLSNNDEFLKLIGCICKSVVKYCHSNFMMSQDDCQSSPRLSSEGTSEININRGEIREMNVDGDNKITTEEKKELLIQSDDESARSHASCPALANTASSFEFLYEEESECSKETILASLSKPVDTILGYALNDNPPLFPPETFIEIKKFDQSSYSPTESGESGYSSNSSKRLSSVTNFFKRPNIAALFKPVPSLQRDIFKRRSKISLFQATPSNTEYNLMTQQCQEYAQKVRQQSESREQEEPFQEIPLDVLLGKTNESFNSSCSLCRELSMSGQEVKNVSSVSLNDLLTDADDSLVQSDNDLETLIYYGSRECNPSLEIVKVKHVQPVRSAIDICRSQKMLDCDAVLSNTNLNSYSLTFIESGGRGCGDYLIDYEKLSELSKKKHDELRSVFRRSKSNLSNIVSSTLISGSDKSKDSLINSDIGIPLETSKSCNWIPNLVNNSDIRKSLAKKFFENLIQVYDKEIMVTRQLFQDDDFFAKDLMSLLEDGHKAALGTRSKQKFKHIRGKLKDCIGKVFSSKADENSIREGEAVKALSEKLERAHQENLKILAYNARRYFSLFVQAVRINKDINDEMKIFGLLKLLERIESGDFAVLRKEENVNFEEEIREQVKEGFLNVYKISVKEAKKCKRALTEVDLQLIRVFICKYRIGLLSKTDLIATYIGRGFFKTETQLRAAVTYLIRSQTRDIDIKAFEEHCMYKL